jgi:hypothetical protein
MVILDTVFFHAFELLKKDPSSGDKLAAGPDGASRKHVQEVVLQFERGYRDTYTDTGGLAKLTELAGAALRTGKANLYYVGSSDAGLIGIVDASEMVDT